MAPSSSMRSSSSESKSTASTSVAAAIAAAAAAGVRFGSGFGLGGGEVLLLGFGVCTSGYRLFCFRKRPWPCRRSSTRTRRFQ
jgi:hypothetical protein